MKKRQTQSTVKITAIEDFCGGNKAQYITLHGLQSVLDTAANILSNGNKYIGDIINGTYARNHYKNFVGMDYIDVIKTNEVVAKSNINIDEFNYMCEEKSNDWNDVEKDYKYDVAGLSYDMGEYLSGTPEYWLTSIESEVKPLIKLYFATGVPAYISNQEICDRAQKQLSILLYFLKNNYPCELHTIELSMARRKYHVIDVNFGLYNEIPFLDFLYGFATSTYYRGLILEILITYYMHSYNVPHVNFRVFYCYLNHHIDNDCCNVVLTSNYDDYTDNNIKEFLESNDFASGNTYYFGSY